MTFAPANDPQVMVFLMIDEPQGVYYGGTVGGPAMQEMLQNILPYLGIPKEGEISEDAVVVVPDVTGMTMAEAKNALWQAGLTAQTDEGEIVVSQLPPVGQEVNRGTKVLLYGT